MGGDGSGRKPESKEVARVHYRALKDFLREWLEQGELETDCRAKMAELEADYEPESQSTRASAREKLTRLTKLQFQELSTDVYDELLRRLDLDNAPAGAGELLHLVGPTNPLPISAAQVPTLLQDL